MTPIPRMNSFSFIMRVMREKFIVMRERCGRNLLSIYWNLLRNLLCGRKDFMWEKIFKCGRLDTTVSTSNFYLFVYHIYNKNNKKCSHHLDETRILRIRDQIFLYDQHNIDSRSLLPTSWKWNVRQWIQNDDLLFYCYFKVGFSWF